MCVHGCATQVKCNVTHYFYILTRKATRKINKEATHNCNSIAVFYLLYNTAQFHLEVLCA